MSEGILFGPYRTERVLGQGGMGIVYRAVHEKTKEVVAVKVVSNSVGDNPKFRRRFHLEIETLMKLDHPNIVRLIGFGEERGQLFYSMEMVEGVSLQQHIRKVKKLSWENAISIAIEVCSALKHAHDSGVIHRDIKPANILLTPKNTTKLTDFGIAKLFGASELTAEGSMLGTVDFMAPEQVQGSEISPRTDLYAVGSLLYACLAGRPPFSGRQLTVVLHALKHEPPPPLDLINPDVPEELVELINDLLQKDPAHRPPTALAVSNRLKAMQAGLKRRQIAESSAKLSDSITLAEPAPQIGVTEVTQMPPSAVVPRAATVRPGGVRGVDTLASQGAASQGERPSEAGESIRVRTHFKTVDDSDRIRASTSISSGTYPQEMPQQIWLSIAGLVGMLLVLCGFAWWLLQAPSADRLYAAIVQAQDNGDVESAGDSIRQFLTHHASDHRAAEVQGIADELELTQTIRRLQAQARRAGGSERMTPAKGALLEALQLRWDQPERAKKKLESWLAVFSNSGTAEPSLNMLTKVATSVLEDLRQLPPAGDDRQVELERLIAWGKENLKGEAQAKFYRGIVELFSGKEWARPFLEKLPTESPFTKGGSALEN